LARRTGLTATTRSRHAPLDAIIVPAFRGAAALESSITLAMNLEIPLVALCSGQTVATAVGVEADRLGQSRLIAIDVPEGYRHELLPTETSADRFQLASAARHNDLALKRNLGLLLARLLGWTKVLFIDDDIGHGNSASRGALTTGVAARVAAQLDSSQVAGLVCRDFPDNSVVCHARRLAGLPQDTFVSGAVLGVNCSDQPLPFFPDVYNEDWFFFARPAANRELAQVGEAWQDPYDPFADPRRAQREEFGDLLAEGLFTLFESQPEEMPFSARLREADEAFWLTFIEARAATVEATSWHLSLKASEEDTHTAALSCLFAAHSQLSLLSPELCLDFVQAWESDLSRWERRCQRLRSVPDASQALAELEIAAWCSTGNPIT
jgi:hypothetical protein